MLILQQTHPPDNRPDSPTPDTDIEVRSILMRLYRSRLNGEDFYPQQFINGHAPDLLNAGWIVEQGQGYRLSEAGVRAWAEMVKPLLRNSSCLPWMNELKALNGKRIKVKLRKAQINTLARLAAAGGILSTDEVGRYGLVSLQNKALVTVADQEVCLTAAGRQALAQQDAIVTTDSEKPFAPDPEPPAPPEETLQGCCCGDCIKAQAFDLIAARYPKVRELAEAMQRQRDLLETLTS